MGWAGASAPGTGRRSLPSLSTPVAVGVTGMTLHLTAACASDSAPELPPVVQSSQMVEVSLPASGLYHGDEDAPIIMVEFGDMTCPTCMLFHRRLFPTIDSVYIEPGRVRFRYVELPSTPERDSAAVTLYCLGSEVSFPLAHRSVRNTLGGQQVSSPAAAAQFRSDIRERIDRCRQDPSTLASIQAERNAARTLGVSGTPTFVIGREHSDGRVVGWAIVGIPGTSVIRDHLDAAKVLVSRD